jgi:uridine phosphorylase
VVLEEVAWLGARVVLRAGTAMATADPRMLGDFIVPVAAIRGEHTSATYVPPEYPAVADHALLARAVSELERMGQRVHVGLMASYDGFYSELFIRGEDEDDATPNPLLASLQALSVEAADMETSALLAIGRYRGVRCASLCAITVDMESRRALHGEERTHTEEVLVRAALETISKG